MMPSRPQQKPLRPEFSCGPTVKRPGWRVAGLDGAVTGRWHRSAPAAERLAELTLRVRALAGIPQDHRILLLPGSNTGAFEAALWNLLGVRPADVLAFDSFGRDWLADVVTELNVIGSEVHRAPYGQFPSLERLTPGHDLVFVWNGTTSGVCVPDAGFLERGRRDGGLALCDATSIVFARPLPWHLLDATSFSWQKMLGSEAAHGMLVLSPEAVQRLDAARPCWPVPKLLRLYDDLGANRALLAGDPINTPSMLAVEDCLDALRWAESIGGARELEARVNRNRAVVEAWVEASDWVDFLATHPAERSPTSVCLKIVAPEVLALGPEQQRAFANAVADRLEAEEAGYDLRAYRKAPPGLRIWCGATVETEDLAALLPWLDWSFACTVGDRDLLTPRATP